MNKHADFGEKRFDFIESVSHPLSEDTFVICQCGSGEKHVCTLSEWEEHAIPDITIESVSAKVTTHSSKQEKIDLFLSLFRGREEVYAKRYYNLKSGKSGYVPACSNEWAKGLCNKKATACKDCPNRDFLPLTEEVITHHLRGDDSYCRDVAGIYPLLEDETTYILAIDFDDDCWKPDVSAFRSVCCESGIPVHIERSRSGNGAHAWFFFEVPVSAADARKFGSGLLTFAMSRRHEIRFSSYDRLFPNQDTMPKGGFGNLIALPFQGRAVMESQNSVFIDEDFRAYSDQWAYLSGIRKISAEQLEKWTALVCKNGELGELTKSDHAKPWETGKSALISHIDFMRPVEIVQSNLLYIQKCGLSQPALNKIKRLAAFKNPDFYKAQAMRMPTYNKPRVIDTSEETADYLGIPRGCESRLTELLDEAEADYSFVDRRNQGTTIDVSFSGRLRDDQIPAADALLQCETGVLSATTAFGKTVIGAYLIGQRKVNTLILVHTSALLSQWKKSLEQFLTLPEELPELSKVRGRKRKASPIGQLGGGKNTLTGVVDIAIIQSLFEGKGAAERDVKGFVKEYGMVLCDECHHVSAFSFEKVLRTANAKYVYGLTATPTRQDGQHPIIFMQCGPIRYQVSAKEQAEKQGFSHIVIPRFTSARLSDTQPTEIQNIYREICENDIRSQMIVQDIRKAVQSGRTPIVLTERKEHALRLSELLSGCCENIFVLLGSDSVKEKRLKLEQLKNVPPYEPLIVVATGKYIGEGFDEPRLDTLFLAMPIAWKGTLAQYAGRLHRNYKGKSEVQIYDYIDIHISVLDNMYRKRLRGYAELGYSAKSGADDDKTGIIFDTGSFYAPFARDIENVEKALMIISPFVRKARVNGIIKLLAVPLSKQAAVTVITRPPEDYKLSEQPTIASILDILRDAGIGVTTKNGIHQKYAIIDQHIVWYGSINFLSFGRSEESIMRFQNRDIAGELLDSAKL